MIDKIIDWNLDKLPKDPKTQLQYIYYLNSIIVVVLIGFTINNLYLFFKLSQWNYLLGALLTSVFFLMSLFSYKQTRMAYKAFGKAQGQINQIVDDLTPEKMEEMLKNGRKSTESTKPAPNNTPIAEKTYLG